MSLRSKKTRRKSVIVNAFGAVSKRIYRFIQNGVFGRFFSSYDTACANLENSWLARLFKRKKKASLKYAQPIAEQLPSEADGIVSYEDQMLHKSLRDRFSEKFDNSRLICCARKLKFAMLNTSMVTYGLLLFGFALFFLISQSVVLFL